MPKLLPKKNSKVPRSNKLPGKNLRIKEDNGQKFPAKKRLKKIEKSPDFTIETILQSKKGKHLI